MGGADFTGIYKLWAFKAGVAVLFHSISDIVPSFSNTSVEVHLECRIVLWLTCVVNQRKRKCHPRTLFSTLLKFHTTILFTRNEKPLTMGSASTNLIFAFS